MAEDTRDEAFFWISRRREKKMASQLAELKEATDDIEETVDDGQAGLDAFAGDPPGTTRSRKPTIARQTVTMAATTTTPTPDSPTSRRRRETERRRWGG